MAKSLSRGRAKLTPNSGAGKIKGDIHFGNFLIEHKFTDKRSYILKLDMLRKTEREALEAGKEPKWILTIDNNDYTLTKGAS